MRKQVVIRKMRVQDAKAVARIHTESWQFAYKGIVPQSYLDEIDVKKREENWAKGIIDDPNLIRLVAENDKNEIEGFVCGLKNRDEDSDIKGELWAIYVSPNKIKTGVGKLLFQSFKSELIKRGFFTMNVWVLEKNQQARNFYEKVGGKLSPTSKEIEIGGKKLTEVSYEYK